MGTPPKPKTMSGAEFKARFQSIIDGLANAPVRPVRQLLALR